MIMDNYEQKYKKALEAVKFLQEVNPSDEGIQNWVKDNFPELKESENERIRKAILNYLKKMWGNCKDNVCGVHVEDAIAWVEKQGEQKPADKVEPKFHEGEWLCENEPNNYARFIQILETINVQGKERYRISRDIHNDEDIVDFGFVEKYYHKFDIQDAKDGDVLVDVYGNIGIFDKCYDFDWMSSCSLGNNGGFQYFTVEHENEKTYPATKEQRELLFQKMTEESYEWDEEKKELKEIKPKKLDPDKVIEWMKNTFSASDMIIGKFKKEFEL